MFQSRSNMECNQRHHDPYQRKMDRFGIVFDRRSSCEVQIAKSLNPQRPLQYVWASCCKHCEAGDGQGDHEGIERPVGGFGGKVLPARKVFGLLQSRSNKGRDKSPAQSQQRDYQNSGAQLGMEDIGVSFFVACDKGRGAPAPPELREHKAGHQPVKENTDGMVVRRSLFVLQRRHRDGNTAPFPGKFQSWTFLQATRFGRIRCNRRNPEEEPMNRGVGSLWHGRAGPGYSGAALAVGISAALLAGGILMAKPWKRKRALGFMPVRDAGPENMEFAPPDWDQVDEAVDESFPASDPPSHYAGSRNR
jgi:hypothetical protein